jgi:peroxin-4
VGNRLLKELASWRDEESKEETGIERLGPVADDDLLNWEAVINGRGIPGGYDGTHVQDDHLFPLQRTL